MDELEAQSRFNQYYRYSPYNRNKSDNMTTLLKNIHDLKKEIFQIKKINEEKQEEIFILQQRVEYIKKRNDQLLLENHTTKEKAAFFYNKCNQFLQELYSLKNINLKEKNNN